MGFPPDSCCKSFNPDPPVKFFLFVSETVYPPYPKLIPMISANIKNGTQVLRTPAVSVYLPIKKNQMAIPTIPRPKMRDSM